jgi:hypothetical protein
VALLAIHLGILHLAAWSLRMSWMVMWGSALSCLCNVVDWGDHMLDMYIGIYIYTWQMPGLRPEPQRRWASLHHHHHHHDHHHHHHHQLNVDLNIP